MFLCLSKSLFHLLRKCYIISIADIMLSWRGADGWSDDLAVPGATGGGEQNHPAIQLDKEGNLHIAWLERATIGGPTRLRYMFGKAVQ